MDVKDLIELLKKQPQDATVLIGDIGMVKKYIPLDGFEIYDLGTLQTLAKRGNRKIHPGLQSAAEDEYVIILPSD